MKKKHDVIRVICTVTVKIFEMRQSTYDEQVLDKERYKKISDKKINKQV